MIKGLPRMHKACLGLIRALKIKKGVISSPQEHQVIPGASVPRVLETASPDATLSGTSLDLGLFERYFYVTSSNLETMKTYMYQVTIKE